MPSAALADARQYLQHALAAHAARDALATRLCGSKGQKELAKLDHASGLIHDDHAAGAHHGTRLLQRVEIDAQVESRCGNASPQRAAGLHGLEFSSVGDPAADIKDDLSNSNAHRHLDEPGILDLACQSENGRARAPPRSNRGKPLGAL